MMRTSWTDSNGNTYAWSDISSVYAGQIAGANRGVAIIKGEYVLIQDEIISRDDSTKLIWNMVTPANVQIKGPNSAILEKDGN